ncbi:hypothetical protein Aduo_014452 [Ancylostoma duodenale]
MESPSSTGARSPEDELIFEKSAKVKQWVKNRMKESGGFKDFDAFRKARGVARQNSSVALIACVFAAAPPLPGVLDPWHSD